MRGSTHTATPRGLKDGGKDDGDDRTNWAGNITYTAKELHRPTRSTRCGPWWRAARGCGCWAAGTRSTGSPSRAPEGVLLSMADLPPVIDVDTTARTVRVVGRRTVRGTGPRGARARARAAQHGVPAAHLGGRVGGDRHPRSGVGNGAAGDVRARGGAGHGGRRRCVIIGAGRRAVRRCRHLAGRARCGHRAHPRPGAVLRGRAARLHRTAAGRAGRGVRDGDGSAYSVSLFTDWRAPGFRQVWLKRRTDQPRPDFPWAAPAAEKMHPVPGMPAVNCTEQFGVPGPWHERLPHFRAEFTPEQRGGAAVGVPAAARARGGRAARARRDPGDASRRAADLRGADRRRPTTSGSAPPTGGTRWRCTSRGSRTRRRYCRWCGGWRRRWTPSRPRPHWGKVFDVPAAVLRGRYPRLGDFRALTQELDPRGKFANAFVRGVLAGTEA